MKRYPCINTILSLIYVVNLVGCSLASANTGVGNLEHFREKRRKGGPGGPGGPGGENCGPGDLVSRCTYDVDGNIQWSQWSQSDENYPFFEYVPFDTDKSRSEASRYCRKGTHLAVIGDAVLLDEAASTALYSLGDTNYWVDVRIDLDNVDSFLLPGSTCTCFNDAFSINSQESTFMEVKQDKYKIKKKRSTDKKMMRGVICQIDEVTTTKPQPSTTGAPSINTQGTNPKRDMNVPTNPASTQKSFDWIVFLLCVIAITLIIGLFVSCVICWRIKSKNRQKNGIQTVVCAIEPLSKELDVSEFPSAPPAYEPSEYQGHMHPPEGAVYASYEIPMDKPHASNFQQPAGLYNGSTGYIDMESPMYDELKLNTNPAEYSYAYADRKSIAELCNTQAN